MTYLLKTHAPKFLAVVLAATIMTACGASDPTVDLAHAGSFKNTTNLKKYLNKGVNVNYQDEDGDSALMNAVTFGNLKNVKVLLAKGANVHLRNKDKDTAMILISLFDKPNDPQILKALLAKGANINDRDKDGETALDSAIVDGMLVHVKMLLDNGANVNNRDNQGETPIFEVCTSEKSTDKQVLDLLLAKGANINARDKDGDTMAALSACTDNKALFAYMKSKGLK